MVGLRPAPKSYGFVVNSFDLGTDGRIEYAQWQHPKDSIKSLSSDSVNELRKFLQPGDIAIDIGAHTGDSTIPIALAVGRNGCVLALEPNKFVFPVLQKNADLNLDKTQIVPLMFAATPVDGPIEFEYSDSGYCNGGRHEGISKWRHGHAFTLIVEGRNLVSFLQLQYPQFLHRIRFVKVDAEGFDHAVLQSIVPILKSTQPYIKAEVFKRTTLVQRQQFLSFLQSLGYAVFRVKSDADYCGDRITVANVMQWQHYDVFCIPEKS